MPFPIASRRLEVFAAARAQPGEQLRFDPSRLRFHLGTSLGDLRIPVHVAPDAVAILRGAAAEIALLLATHHKALAPGGELDRLYLREDYASLPRATGTLGPSGGGPDLRAAAQLGAGAHPALLGGLTCAWMGPGGKGRSFTALWIETLRQGFAEMEQSRRGEETPVLAAMALYGAMQGVASDIREALPGPPADRYLRAAALTALWIAARTGLARAWRDAGRPPDDPLLPRLEAALSPGTLLGGRGPILAGGSTLYGCDLSPGIPRAEELVARLAAGGDPDTAIAEVAHALSADEELSRRAELAIAAGRLREMIAVAVAGAEGQGRGQAVAELRELYCAPGGLATALSEDGARRALIGRMAATHGALPSGDPAAMLDRAGRAVKGWKPKEPAASLGIRRDLARSEYAVAATALMCDAALERMIAPARRSLTPRTGAEAEGGAEAEYEAGRLYRIAARPGPILKAGRERPLGHLFADVKDFTRRTGLLGQAAMAEFLRREFYLPILTAAKRHYSGMQHLADRGGVSVNNLLGDAISFSGDIAAMVELAADIRRLLAAYEARLAREVSTEAVSRQIAAIEEGYRQGTERAAAALAEAKAAIGAAAAGSREQAEAQAGAARAAVEQARLAGERDQALARARGEGLEAGVFISHGPAPLVVTIDDEVFGANRVAIAEKINESARGTARAGSARARADAQLAAERAARRTPALRHAWSVFVGAPLVVAVPQDAEAVALRSARAGDLAAAMRAVAVSVREAIEAAARSASDGAGDIYNSGAALSEQALTAFLEAVGETRTVRRVELEPADVPADLAARFWFGSGRQTLIACFHPDRRPAELFRHVGKAAFKGLPDVPVWELCADVGGPAALLDALGPTWLRRGAP